MTDFSARSVKVRSQYLSDPGGTKLVHRLRLDLAYTLTGDFVDRTDLFERPGLIVIKSETQCNDARLSLVE